MPKATSMTTAYKLLRKLDEDRAMTLRELQMRFPFRNVKKTLAFLESLGYVSKRITAEVVESGSMPKIRHTTGDFWYPTELGLTALDQFLETYQKRSKWALIALIAAAAICVLILYFIIRDATN